MRGVRGRVVPCEGRSRLCSQYPKHPLHQCQHRVAVTVTPLQRVPLAPHAPSSTSSPSSPSCCLYLCWRSGVLARSASSRCCCIDYLHPRALRRMAELCIVDRAWQGWGLGFGVWGLVDRACQGWGLGFGVWGRSRFAG